MSAGGARDAEERTRVAALWQHEAALLEEGLGPVAGVDEAGLGTLCGPVTAGAVILPPGTFLAGLDDSKQVEEEARDALAPLIRECAVAWAIGWVDVAEIDRLGVDVAGLLAMRRAVEGLAVTPGVVLVDGTRRIHPLGPRQRLLAHGDALSASIAAASILAKTARDARMRELDAEFPGLGLAQHKGYGSPEHLEVLRQRGPTRLHRRHVHPVAEATPEGPRQRTLF